MSDNPVPERPSDPDGPLAEAVTPPAAPDLQEPQAFMPPPGQDQPAYPDYTAYQPPAPDAQTYPDAAAYQPPAPDAQSYPDYQQPAPDTQAYVDPTSYQQPPGGEVANYGQPPQGSPDQGYAQQPYPAYQVGVQQKSKIVAGILAILFGWLGIHNFYLGRTSRGLTQLLVSILSLLLLAWAMSIWGIIEGILILTGSEKYRTDGKGIPLKD